MTRHPSKQNPNQSPPSTGTVNSPSSFSLHTDFREALHDIAAPRYDAVDAGDDERVTILTERVFNSPWGIGNGSGRTVFPLPDTAFTGGRYDEYVVKLAEPAIEPKWDGCRQNNRETHVWQDLVTPESLTGQYLVPVVAVDPDRFWLIMPRGTPENLPDKQYYQWNTEAERILDGVVWRDDISRENTVTLSVVPRLCDYGIAPPTSK